MAEPARVSDTPTVDATDRGILLHFPDGQEFSLSREQAAELSQRIEETLEVEYTDEQFEKDIERALPAIDQMAAEALTSLRKGSGIAL